MGYCCGTLNSSFATAFSEDFSARSCKLFTNKILYPVVVFWQNLPNSSRMLAAFNLLKTVSFISQSP